MNIEKDSFNKMALLTGAKVFGIFFSIFIPMYLGRKLPIETYGTYKQLMLFFWFAQVGLNFGLDDSAYFYLRRDPKNFPLYSFNALVFNLLATGLLWLLMVLFKHQIAHVLKNPSLADYLPLLGYLILATVSSMQYGGILIGLNRFKERLALEVGLESIKSLSIIAAFFLFNSVYMVLVFLSILMTLNLLATIHIIEHYKKRELLHYRDSLKYFADQAKFGIPLGLSRIMQNLLNIENFLISSFLGIVQFTFYSVGCFENPLINAARGSLFELVNIEMADGHGDSQKMIAAWKGMTRKLFMIIIPFVIYMMFFSRELIVFIFSAKYLPSVPFFLLFNIYVVLASLNPEPIFRATHKTGLALKIRSFGTILGIIMIISGAYYGGALQALSGKILAIALINFSGLFIGARILGTTFLHLFDWRQIGKISLISLILSALLKYLFMNSTWHYFWILALSFSLYVIFHFFLSCKINLIKEDEILHLKNLFNRFLLRS